MSRPTTSRLLVRRARMVDLPGLHAIAVEGDRIRWIGPDADAGPYDGAEQVIDAETAWLLPAFVDAHLHLVQAGFLLTQLDLREATSLADALDRIAAFAAAAPDDGEVLLGHGWDESAWPERRAPLAAEIERAAPGRRVFLTRLDAHSAVLSPAMMDVVDDLSTMHGYDTGGHVHLDAMARTVDAVATLVGPEQRLNAARAAAADLAQHGVAAFHEAAAPHLGPSYEVALVRQAVAEAGLEVSVYWGEYAGFETAAELGARGVAGDLNIDGSIGSRTAALHTSYADRPGHSGHAYLDAEAVAAHLVECTRRGVQGGFHCIGEAGLVAVADGLRAAESIVGREALRSSRHRLEHVEMPTDDVIRTIADLGVVASMQPAFDALWGGPAQMYAERLGERWRGMNPVGALDRAGVVVAFGSDAPVTSPRPWDALRAACGHHEAEQRVDPATALRMHTENGWKAAGVDDAGRLEAGQAAHLALWDSTTDPLTLTGTPALRALVVSGRSVLAA